MKGGEQKVNTRKEDIERKDGLDLQIKQKERGMAPWAREVRPWDNGSKRNYRGDELLGPTTLIQTKKKDSEGNKGVSARPEDGFTEFKEGQQETAMLQPPRIIYLISELWGGGQGKRVQNQKRLLEIKEKGGGPWLVILIDRKAVRLPIWLKGRPSKFTSSGLPGSQKGLGRKK